MNTELNTKMGAKNKAGKGIDVTIGVNGGRLRLTISRHLYQDAKQRYIALRIDDTPDNRLSAQLRLVELQREINAGTFDPTLVKYQDWQAQDNARKYRGEKGISLGELWDYWCDYQQPLIAASTYNQKYKMTYARSIAAIGKDRLVCPATAKYTRDWLIKYRNKQDNICLLSCLERAADRLINDGKLKINNPFLEMSKRLATTKNTKIDNRDIDEIITASEQRNYFTIAERDAVLDVFLDAFPHYWLFTYFRFYTGCRFEESIGIEWQDISEDCKTIIFRRAYSESGKTIKVTKVGLSRRFNCPPKLTELLLEHRTANYRSGSQAVFTNHSNKYIALAYYRRLWNRVVDHLIEEGKIGIKLSPKHTRHTLTNLAEQAGHDERDIARQMGHSPTTRNKHYRDRSMNDGVLVVD
jgi:integrase